MTKNSKVEGLIDALRKRVVAGEFGSEGRLPSFRSLAAQYETTQETMNKTMQALQAEGLLTSMGAKGVFVNPPSVRLIGFVPDFFKYLQQQDLDPQEEYIEKPSVLKVPAAIAQEMNLTEDSLIVRRFKRQKTNQVIFRIEETFYPKEELPDEAIEMILKDVSYVPYNDINKHTGLVLSAITEKSVCRLPTPYEQELLKIVRNNPVIDMKRTVYSQNRKSVIYHQHLILNANLFSLSYDYTVGKGFTVK